MKILIWQTAYLGDVILTTPLIRTIRENFPNSQIGFVGRPFIKELLKGYDIELIPFGKSLKESFSIVKKIKGYDVAVSPHRSMRTALILFFSGIKRRIGFNKSELPFLYTDLVEHRWELHEVDRNLSLLKPLGVKKFVRETKLFADAESIKKFGLREKDYVVISPFSNFPLKEWNLENWNELIKRIDTRIVITGTKNDIKKAEGLIKTEKVINLVGKTSLRELMGVINGARLVVANDSSPVHIANALGVPAITVYTATSSKYGFYPLIGAYLDNPAPCSPCSPNPKKCKTGTKECLRLPAPEDVLSLIKNFL